MIDSSRNVDSAYQAESNLSLLKSTQEFVNFCQQYISGRERSQAQIFLDRFFQAFGHQGALQAGAEYEVAVAKGSKKGKTGFADLVWKPRVLIEMKAKGENLAKHYRQAFNYWTRLVPNRPRYVMLCNFDEFWLYDFNLQVDEPVDVVALKDLPKRISAFGFMEIVFKSEKPPLRKDETGAIRVGNSRVLLEIVIQAFKDGASPESIVSQYSTLTLSDTYGAIAYYLKNQDAVEAYLNQREKLAESVKQRLETIQPDLSQIRSRLLSQRNL